MSSEYLQNIEKYMTRVEGGVVKIGTEHPLKCTLEGRRYNETPVREAEIQPFYILKTKVINTVFELVNPGHVRPPQSMDDDMPVVDVMYGEVLTFCKRLNEATGMSFRLPTENEWVMASAPLGWEFSFQEEPYSPDVKQGHVYNDGSGLSGVAKIFDSRWKPNHLGLDQMGHNVSEFVYGHRRIPDSLNGASDDGMYCIAKGGNWGHCPYSMGVNRRIVVDVADRNPRIGFRLAHNV